jgi:23S rRNA (pseudouridine1915-N3)-methyltransferase
MLGRTTPEKRMKKLQIRAIGKLPEPWQKEAVHMYETRLQGFGGIEITELPEGHGGSDKPDEEKTKENEAVSLLKGIPEDSHIVALDKGGIILTSEKFSKQMESWASSSSQIVFLIGGSWGLGDEVITRAHTILSFGPMTFPHGLARVMLMEQIYRAKMIEKGGAYHK